ncbi:hypothetical protein Q7P37_001582 [Cladosporium fusiforme]
MAHPAADNGKELLPLRDVVICSTYLPQDVRVGQSPTTDETRLYLYQIRLADVADALGASNKLDLTGEYVAKERPDIVVLSPSWIDAVREAWMDGNEVDVEGLERMHRCPAFFGLKISITGYPDIVDRDRISGMIEHEGAEYHGDLTKQVTHLLVANTGSAKYKAAKEWGLHTVSMKWLEDSMQRKMALDPIYYDPTMYEQDQGNGAYRKEAVPRTSLGKRLRNEGPSTSGANENGKRKLRRHASKRLVDHSQEMWQDISAVETSIVAPSETDQWTAGDEDSQLALGRSFSRPQVRKSLDAAQSPAVTLPPQPDGLFSGWRIVMQGFEKEKANRLTQYLLPNGARVVKRLEDLESHEDDEHFSKRCILVPHQQPFQHVHITKSLSGTVTATEWWVERCIHHKQIVDPEQDILSQPLWDLEILGFSKLTVSTTGFSGVDYRQVAEAIKLAGATYQEQLLPTISVLVSGSPTVKKEKAYYASKHKIPVVTAEWLWTCLKSRRKTSFDRFKIELPHFDPSNGMKPSAPSPAPSDPLKKSSSSGTGKDGSAPSRLSNTRKRHATPSLTLQAHRSDPMPSKSAGPFVHEDDDDDENDIPAKGAGVQASEEKMKMEELPDRSAPLRSISSNASSIKAPSGEKPRETQENKPYVADKDIQPNPLDEELHVSAETENHPEPPNQPPARAHADLTADLASLVEQQQRRTTSSEHHNPAQRLKHRKLGRAASGSSFGNRTGSNVTNVEASHGEASLSESSEGMAAAGSFTVEPEGLPSTQIGR